MFILFCSLMINKQICKISVSNKYRGINPFGNKDVDKDVTLHHTNGDANYNNSSTEQRMQRQIFQTTMHQK